MIMNIKNLILSGMCGTTVMSIFSYITAHVKEEHYEEPELLMEIVEEAFEIHDMRVNRLSGWTLHFMMGFLMTAILQQVWKERNIIPSSKHVILGGLMAGVSGILIWKMFLKINPRHGLIPFSRFAGHLLLAHIVFVFGVATVSKLMDPFKPYRLTYIGPEESEPETS